MKAYMTWVYFDWNVQKQKWRTKEKIGIHAQLIWKES